MKLEGEAEEERIEELLEQADTNKDGQISIIGNILQVILIS